MWLTTSSAWSARDLEDGAGAGGGVAGRGWRGLRRVALGSLLPQATSDTITRTPARIAGCIADVERRPSHYYCWVRTLAGCLQRYRSDGGSPARTQRSSVSSHTTFRSGPMPDPT